MSLADAAARLLATRFAAAVPPHHPEPLPGEPFAPVYDHIPLGPADYLDTGWIRPGPRPDPIDFGGQEQPRHDPSGGYAPWWCARCDVRWGGDGPCWCCGQPSAPPTGI